MEIFHPLDKEQNLQFLHFYRPIYALKNYNKVSIQITNLVQNYELSEQVQFFSDHSLCSLLDCFSFQRVNLNTGLQFYRVFLLHAGKILEKGKNMQITFSIILVGLTYLVLFLVVVFGVNIGIKPDNLDIAKRNLIFPILIFVSSSFLMLILSKFSLRYKNFILVKVLAQFLV
jgi:hypothetical protein